MKETDYWFRLEFRLCGEFAGMPEKRLRYFWCDGFNPVWYRLDDPEPRIEGLTWIGNAPRIDEWDFTLFLPEQVGSRDEIEWESLLPPEGVTRWLAIDQFRRRIEIEPSAAVPDLP